METNESKISKFYEGLKLNKYLDQAVSVNLSKEHYMDIVSKKSNSLINYVDTCPNFWVGDLGKVPEFKQLAETYLHLPFNKCIFEFFLSYRERPENGEAVAPDGTHIINKGHHVFCFCESLEDREAHLDGFMPRFRCVPIEYQHTTVTKDGSTYSGWFVLDYSTMFTVGVDKEGIPAMRGDTNVNSYNKSINPYHENMIRDIREDNLNFIYGIYSTLALMGCNNITTEKINPPKALQKARTKKDKTKLISYYVLKLKYPKEKHDKKELTGTHSSPRFHWRMGHIRHLENRLLYIHPTTVGKPENGVIEKDYHLIF